MSAPLNWPNGTAWAPCWEPAGILALPQLRRRFELLIGDLDRACQQIEGDPLYLAEHALELPVKDHAALESEDHGVVFEPLAEVVDGPHASLLLEARADEWAFCARTMCDVARAMASLPRQAWLCSPFGLIPLFEAEAPVEHAVASQRRRL